MGDPGLLLAAGATSALLIDLVVVLGAAAFVTLALQRVRLATIPGYLIAGALVGPHALAIVQDAQNIEAISQLAIIMLMFGIGLHMDLNAVRGGMLRSIWAGVLSTALSVLLAFPIAMIFGLGFAPALAFGMAVSMSSTAAVLRILQQRRELEQTPGRLALGILIAQDLLVVVMLALMPVIAVWAGVAENGEEGQRALRIARQVALTVGGVGLLVVLGRWVLPRVMEVATRGAGTELLFVLGGAVALGAALITSRVGLSAELGAFLAGFLLASTDFRHQIAGQLAPLRDLFMAIFFVAVGFQVDLDGLAPIWWVVPVASALLILIKALSIAFSAWSFGAPSVAAVRCGVTLAQAGEFSLVLGQEAFGRGIIDEQTRSVLIGIVVVTLMLTPSFVAQGRTLAIRTTRWPTAPWVARMHRSRAHQEPEGGDKKHPVIIAGFGPVGRAVAQRLDLAGIPSIVVDLNAATIRRQRELGRSAMYGDVTNPHVLESAGVRHAPAVIITIPDDDAMLRACRAIRAEAPDVFIAARSNVLSNALVARGLGADHVTVEEIATAERMAEELIERLGSGE